MEDTLHKTSPIRSIATELPFFKTVDQRELLLGVLGALVLRRISLKKASEIMGMEKDTFMQLLDTMKVDFSYLEKSDVTIEKGWQ